MALCLHAVFLLQLQWETAGKQKSSEPHGVALQVCVSGSAVRLLKSSDSPENSHHLPPSCWWNGREFFETMLTTTRAKWILGVKKQNVFLFCRKGSRGCRTWNLNGEEKPWATTKRAGLQKGEKGVVPSSVIPEFEKKQ